MNGLALCAGVGGLELGLHLAIGSSYRTVAYCEREGPVAAVLAARMADGGLDQAPVWDDLATFDGRRWRGAVDIVTAGYPCQPFSVAGKRRGKDDPRHLWPHVARIISEVEPIQVFLENVPGHLRLGFEEVVSDLRRMGYRVAAGLFSASEIGAPHRRQRLFMLGVSNAFSGLVRQEQRRRESGWTGKTESRDAGEAVADRAGDRRNVLLQQGRSREADPDAQRCSEIVVDTEQSRWQASRQRRNIYARAQSQARIGGVGNTFQSRLEGRLESKLERADQLPPWPPSPEERDRWAEILDRWPQVEPAVRGVAHGLANRVDRLRACGNGVVPVVAAYAYRTLADALGDRT